MEDVKITSYRGATDMSYHVTASVSDLTTTTNNYMLAEFVHEIVRQLAERYIAENYVGLVSKLDQQAIANLAVAESGKKIAEEIRSKSTVLHDGHKTVVNKYNIF